MILYAAITVWLFVLLFLGLRPYSVLAFESWPKLPEDKAARRDHIIVTSLAFVTFLALWFLTAFRGEAIGNDTWNYVAMYERLFPKGITTDKRIEYGYQIYNILLLKITRSSHAYLIITATLMYGAVGIYLFKYSKNPAVSLCLFFACFFAPFTSMLRQGMAMVIALYGYQLLKNGKRIPAALLFLLAVTFHLSAVVCFLLFFDLKILQKLWFVFGMTILCAIISRLGVFKMAVQLVLPQYVKYFHTKYASSGWLAITYYLLLYAGIYFLINRSLDEDLRTDRTVAANFAFMAILIAFGYAINLFDRVCEYFMLFGITEIPNMLYRGKLKHYRLFLFGVCAMMLVMFMLILIFRPGWNHICPYEFWR